MWFITVMAKLENNVQGWLELGECRTWGYYKERDTAVQALHENWTDMREYLYDYAVIEYFEEGIAYCARIERQFFKWDETKKGFFEIDEPECVKHVCNFAIG